MGDSIDVGRKEMERNIRGRKLTINPSGVPETRDRAPVQGAATRGSGGAISLEGVRRDTKHQEGRKVS